MFNRIEGWDITSRSFLAVSLKCVAVIMLATTRPANKQLCLFHPTAPTYLLPSVSAILEFNFSLKHSKPCFLLTWFCQARRAFLKVLKSSNGSHHGTMNNLEKVGGRVGVLGRGESLEVVESEPLQCHDYQLKAGQENMDRQWSNHQRDSRCVREKIQMAYERVDRNSQTTILLS